MDRKQMSNRKTTTMKRTILLILTMIAFYAMGIVQGFIHSIVFAIAVGILAGIVADYIDKRMK